MIQDAKVQERDQLTRENLAGEIVQFKVAAGLLKPEDMDKAREQLVPLSASVLEVQKQEYATVARKLKRPGEKSLSASHIPMAAGVDAMPPGMAEFFTNKLRMSPSDYLKYGRSNTRSIVPEVK
jgi:hypothetical protein